ncbi:hypothetical protein V6N12_060667 [Hibiscus sabdariffa]|uniref:MLO-like protein n=1 Tax=Hibiscus sabdariffa TaxID=183260 RepID=A0ABR2D573_9ROSI
METMMRGRSLAETPTYTVASVITVLVFVCFVVERSIYRFGRWLKKTRRKALFASLEKIKEELMLLGLISLLLAQWARWISEICVNSSLFSSRFYTCSEMDYATHKNMLLESTSSFHNETVIPPKGLNTVASHQCGEGREPFVSFDGLEQLHRFLFVLGITHVFYSCLAVGLAMSKIYSWGKWENQANSIADGNLQAKRNKVMRRQTTFVFQHTSHPWSRSRILIWMELYKEVRLPGTTFRFHYGELSFSPPLPMLLALQKHKLPLSYNFHNYMVRSMEDEFQGILGISWPLWAYAIACIFVNIHGLNIYFWLSFIPAIVVMLVGTKLQHVVSSLALEIKEQTGPPTGTQVKPRDDLFWFGKPEILLRMPLRWLPFSGHWVLVQFWCSSITVPLNVIVTQVFPPGPYSSKLFSFMFACPNPLNVSFRRCFQMGSRFKKALVAESVRESLHSWCKRVKAKSKRDSLHSHTARSVCSLESIVDDDGRDAVTVGTLSRSSSMESLNQITVTSVDSLNQMTITSSEQAAAILGTSNTAQGNVSSRVEEYLSDTINISASQPMNIDEEDYGGIAEEAKVDTLYELFQRT